MKKVILITGENRSGSSLLDLMIGNSKNGFSAGELFRIFRPIKTSEKIKINEPKVWEYDTKIIKFWNEIRKNGEKNVYENLFNSLENVDFIVDSSKNPIWIRNQLKYNQKKTYKLIPIIIYKTPLEFAYSLFKRDQLKYWKRRWIRRHLILFGILENFISVEYSRLVKKPSSHLELICKNIGIDYFKEKENFWENPNKNYFLFGSDTLRDSKSNVYYEIQYNPSHLDFLRKSIDISEKRINEILEILNAYEVESKTGIDPEILKKKEKIKKFGIMNQLELELETSKYYEINSLVYNIKCNADKILRKLNDNVEFK